MKLQPNPSGSQRTIAGHGPGWVDIGGRRYQRSLLITPTAIDADWGPDAFEALAEAHLNALTGNTCDVVLLGTGSRQRFPQPQLLRSLIEAGIGVEIMDTAAACRTYNIVVAEGRAVVAALIVE
jgi:uncharacterized protein